MKSVRVVLLASSMFVVWVVPGAWPQTPAGQPSSSPQATSLAPSSAGTATTSTSATPATQTSSSSTESSLPAEAIPPQDLARQIYDAAFRLNDLLSTVSPDNWKMDAAARKDLNENLDSLRSQLKTLEARRYQFSGQLKNISQGMDVAEAIRALRPALDILVGAVARYQSASDAAPFKQASERLLGLEKPLDHYLASLQANLPLYAGGGPSTASAPAQQAGAAPAQSGPVVPSQTQLTAAAKEAVPIQASPAQPNPQPAPTPSAVSPAILATGTPPASTTPPSAGAPAVAPVVQPQAEARAPSPAELQVQAQTLARQIYDAAYRVNDLLGTLTPGDWNMDDASRKSLNDTFASLRSGLKTLEERRYKFSGQLGNVALGKDVASGIGALRPDLDVVAGDVAKYQNGTAAPFKQAEEQLLVLAQPLERYLASLELPSPPAASSSAGAAGGNTATLETERIASPPTPPPSNTLLVSGAVTPQQMKDLTHEIYVATYRVKDLLSVVNPAAWKASDSARASFQDEVERLRDALKALDDSRAELAQQTGSLPSAFATYKGIPPVISGVNRVADTLAQYQGADAVTQFRQPATWLAKSQNTLGGYFEQMLKRQWGTVQDYETGLASCQKTLNYAMYGRTAAATPMTNIMPVLKGRHVRPVDHKAGRTAAKTASAVANSANKGTRSTRHSRRRRRSRNKTNNGK